jgi:Fic family protein
MASVVKLRWTPDPASGLPRRDRTGCDFEAYVPDELAGRPLSLDGTTAADVSDAERAVERLNRQAGGLADSEAIARLLLRAEAVASSRIEGLEVGSRRLLKAQLAQRLGESADVSATEVLNNIEATRWAVDTLSAADVITVEDLLAIHARLLAGTRMEHHAGMLRTVQNWIGGSAYNPCSAAFVPPPPEHVRGLMEDLCAFCNDDGLPPIVQAAVAHTQFETIHPFVDGNGRTGRVLIHVLLRRRGLAPVVVPPVSLVLATWADDYVGGLTATRYRGDASSPNAVAGLNRWIALFAAATRPIGPGRRGLPAARRRRPSALERAPGPAAQGLRRSPPAQRAARSTDHHRPERRSAHRPQRAGRQPGNPPPAAGRRPRADNRRPPQPRLRGRRAHRRLHRTRAPAREPRRRHTRLAAHSPGAAAPLTHEAGVRRAELPNADGVPSPPISSTGSAAMSSATAPPMT